MSLVLIPFQVGRMKSAKQLRLYMQTLLVLLTPRVWSYLWFRFRQYLVQVPGLAPCP